MFAFLKKLGKAVFISSSLVLLGCGSATNNDQGTSFTNIGFFQTNPDGELEFDCEDWGIGLSGTEVGIDFDTTNQMTSGGEWVYLGLLNNLGHQYIHIDRFYISYDIPGSSVTPPSTSIAKSFVMVPPVSKDAGSEDTQGTGLDSSLPPSFASDACSIAMLSFPIVTGDVKSWIAFNKVNLPDVPFVLEASVYATGVTSGGDRVNTNVGTLPIYIISNSSYIGTTSSDSEVTS